MSYSKRSNGLIAGITPDRPLDHPAFTKPLKVGDQDKPAEQIYEYILHRIVEPLIGNTTTFGSDLNKMGKAFFGDQWMGVVSVDKVPENIPKNHYLVVNLDESNLPGSHWVGIVGDKARKGSNKNDVLLYDSYGRDPADIVPKLSKRMNIKSTDKREDGAHDEDAEQGVLETNCGARTLAALILHSQFGRNAFMSL
jgi:hypothetical protein